MSHTNRALTGAGFQAGQIVLALITGLVLFPLTVRAVGKEAFGLWLASGEIVGYLLLGDLGVFSVLPLLVADRAGANDRHGIARLFSDGMTVAVALCALLAASFVAVAAITPDSLYLTSGNWQTLRVPLMILIALTGASSVFRPFSAILVGVQDITFSGVLGISQAATSAALTGYLVVIRGYGLLGLALASALPPLLTGIAASCRVLIMHRDTISRVKPSASGAWALAREGTGPWLAGFGVRLLSGSTSLILVGLNRTADATIVAATSKAAQLLQNVAWILPDSTLIGLTQVRAAGNDVATRNAVTSILALYLVLTGFGAFAILAVNETFVRMLIGPEFFAGLAVNALLALNLILAAVITSLFKVVASVAFRPAIGAATLTYGALTFGLSYVLCRYGGLVGLLAGTTLSSVLFAIPFGLFLLPKAYSLRISTVLAWWWTWCRSSLPFLLGGAGIGMVTHSHDIMRIALAVIIGMAYAVNTRRIVAEIPWPVAARDKLIRLRLVAPRQTDT